MVRARVVQHPSEWSHGGYNETKAPRRKNVIIAYDRWSKGIAVGGRGFTQQVQSIMGSMAPGRKVREGEDGNYELREHQAGYNAILRP
jgi:putative transposase